MTEFEHDISTATPLPGSRREREKEELRAKILDAARAILLEDGYEHLSMRKVADRIEYSPTTIYLYFKDKADLIQNVVDATFLDLIARFEELREKHKNPVEFMMISGRAYIEFGLEHPAHYRATFIERPKSLTGYTPFEGSVASRCFEYLRDAVARCVEQKIFRSDDVDLVSQQIWAKIHGLTSLLITHPDFPWVERGRLIEEALESSMRAWMKS